MKIKALSSYAKQTVMLLFLLMGSISPALAQEITIVGTVTDKQQKEPLPVGCPKLCTENVTQNKFYLHG